jgi:DNA mismatch repair protein MutS
LPHEIAISFLHDRLKDVSLLTQMTPLLEEYFRLYERHREELAGETVVMLMQVGSFYEAYEVDGPPRGCARVLSDVLRMHLTKKNGSKEASEANPWMVGFPSYVLGKHLAKLNDEGYTVVVYEQKTVDGCRHPERVLKGVYNDLMRYEGEDDLLPAVQDRRLFAVLLDRYRESPRSGRTRCLFSAVCVDMSSGGVLVCEHDTEDHLRDLQSFLLHYSPPEVILCLEGVWTEEETAVVGALLRKSTRLLRGSAAEDATTTGVLREVYAIRKEPWCVPGLERHPSVSRVLAVALTHIRRHDPVLATKLRLPVFANDFGDATEYNTDAFMELNIAGIGERRRSGVAASRQKSLRDILAAPMSSLGRRRLDAMIRRPTHSAEIIRERQGWIRYFLKTDTDISTRVPDLEWLLLRWRRGRLAYRLCGQFLRSLVSIYQETAEAYPEWWDNGAAALVQEIEARFDLDKMMSEDLDFLRCGSAEMEEFMARQAAYHAELQAIGEEHKETFRLQEGAEGEWFLGCTVKKWDAYRYRNPGSPLYELSKNKATVRVSLERLDRAATALRFLTQEKKEHVSRGYASVSEEFLAAHGETLTAVIDRIARLDCFVSLARFFRENEYCFPEILDHADAGGSTVRCVDLRHPIHEKIERDRLFTPYTLELGRGARGMLLYGMNSSGKSTMLKTLGTAVWLAQCGFCVPAASFAWTPFRTLFSKIGTYDNLYAGHSTFVAEMNELGTILRRSSETGLVLCDELTSGTETRSATGIVAATLRHFLEKNITFLFTTHLHTVARIPAIRDDPRLSIRHFRVETNDEARDSLLIRDVRLRYDRRLHDGPGSDLYGIEIARALGLPGELVASAFRFREAIEIIVHEDKAYQASRYNSGLIVDACRRCGSRIGLHTHHITPQEVFDGGRAPPGAHKNGLYNLVVLCESCHQGIHREDA